MNSPTVQSRVTVPRAEEPSLLDQFNTLWFHRRLLFSTALFVIAVGVIVVTQMVPRYTASSTMILGAPKTNLVDIEEVLNLGFGNHNRSAIRTEMEVLRSRVLARKVIGKFDLLSKEEFNPDLRPPGLLSHISPSQWIPEGWRGSPGLESDVELSDDEKDQLKMKKDQLKIERATNIFLAKLKIKSKISSQIVNVSFESTNPKLAAAIANELPEAYIIGQMDAKLEATKKATEWLGGQLINLKEKVENSEKAVESYREQHGLTEVRGARILTSQLAEVNSQLIEARAERAQAETRLQHIRELQKGSGSNIESAKEVMTSSVIQRLWEQEAALTREISELSVLYGQKHNKMKQVNAEISNVRERIDLEIKRVVAGQESEVEVARSKEQSLAKSLKEMERHSGKQTKESIRLHSLEREASANRTLFETFLARFKETSSTTDMLEADARVISKAEIPRKASYPNKKKMLIMIVAGAFFLAIILVLMVQSLKQGLLSPEEIENELGLAAIGVIPTAPGNKPYDYIIDNPNSSFGEALNTLKTSLILSSPDEGVKVLQITSSVPQEGKSTLALAFSRLLAKSGNKVILVDGDLRLASLQKKLGISASSKGLTDMVMSSGGPIEKFVIKDGKSGAFIMPKGGAEYVNATDVFSSHRMRAIIDLLKETFDYIIIDAPPVMAVSDARIIGTLVDTFDLVVQWGKTPRKVIKAAVHLLQDGGTDIAGCVLQQVNLQRYGAYGNSGSGYYYNHGRYGDYYTS